MDPYRQTSDFSAEEKAAFDRGVDDGENMRDCPFDLLKEPHLWDAWQTGASVGRANLRVIARD